MGGCVGGVVFLTTDVFIIKLACHGYLGALTTEPVETDRL